MTAPNKDWTGLKTLEEHDPELFDLIEREKHRQSTGLEMIASENFTSRAVMECLGSAWTNKYAEGEVGSRYYGGNQFVDKCETLAKTRALAAFGLDAAEWTVNVQPYSGSPANMGVLCGLLKPHQRIMGLDLTHGGHLTHGFYTSKKKVSMSSVFFESLPYHVGPDGLIDYDEMETLCKSFCPALLIAGYSAYPRDLDYARFRKAADGVGALLHVDMAHYAGLVATKLLNNPFEHADVVTTTVHKSLRGPRAGMIFIRKARNGAPTGFDKTINEAVFPGLQGGPHIHQVAAIATQMKEVCAPEFLTYTKQVVANSQAFAARLLELPEGPGPKYTIATNGTINHLVMMKTSCPPLSLTGSKVEKILEAVGISVNKNSFPGDKSMMVPGGIRVGACALTTRGMREAEFKTIAGFYDTLAREAARLQTEYQAANPGAPYKLVDFEKDVKKSSVVVETRKAVMALTSQFPMPGYEVEKLRYDRAAELPN